MDQPVPAPPAPPSPALPDQDRHDRFFRSVLARIGAAPRARFDHELTQVRAAFAEHVLGLADLVLVSNPPLDVLRAHRNADTTRRRRSFDLHARLGESLRAWYQALDALDPGRVLWQLPADGLPKRSPPPRPDRFNVALLDEIVASLPFR
ncbi:MAG: hypothetical protein L0K86_13820 [Actinomycetia bacterium]|nr:hypothetical protein [Actinomycetes bacterium]